MCNGNGSSIFKWIAGMLATVCLTLFAASLRSVSEAIDAVESRTEAKITDIRVRSIRSENELARREGPIHQAVVLSSKNEVRIGSLESRVQRSEVMLEMLVSAQGLKPPPRVDNTP